MKFAQDIQLVCMTALAGLLVYTLWLSRYRGLDAHVTVRWVLVQCVAIFAILLWQLLPIFEFTSQLQDRQLLLMVTVLVFAFVAFLILDLLVRISRQSVQIKKLVQELAIQRMRLDAVDPPERSQICDSEQVQVNPFPPVAEKSYEGSAVLQVLFLVWLLAAICLNGLLLNGPLARRVVSKIAPTLEATLKPLLTAAYLQ
jgi:Uncharacterized conserved protein (DUF2304)